MWRTPTTSVEMVIMLRHTRKTCEIGASYSRLKLASRASWGEALKDDEETEETDERMKRPMRNDDEEE